MVTNKFEQHEQVQAVQASGESTLSKFPSTLLSSQSLSKPLPLSLLRCNVSAAVSVLTFSEASCGGHFSVSVQQKVDIQLAVK